MPKAVLVSPHHSASKAGAEILRQGGNAIEAAMAMASTLCIVYPHMSGLGGDSFWLISSGADEKTPIFIDGCGYSGENISFEALQKNGHKQIPSRGVWSALTMAGAVESWSKALDISQIWKKEGEKEFTLSELFSSAIKLGAEGFPVTKLLSSMLRDNYEDLKSQPNFSDTFFIDGRVPKLGEIMRLPALAHSFERLAEEGLDSFYRGRMAAEMAKDLKNLGSPLVLKDFNDYKAEVKSALSMETKYGTFYNSRPPTQGIASLLIIGQIMELYASGVLSADNEADNVHALVEATKNAFILRNQNLADPAYMKVNIENWLKPSFIKKLSENISMDKASEWSAKSQLGDTVWFGVIDQWSNAVSCIQSIYHEFGSGLVLPATGMIWHNRAIGFSLDKSQPNFIKARKKPFHTLNPAMARLNDGRFLSYGTMGGEGQPQTQGAILYRYLIQKMSPAEAIKAPRWLLGRTWGDASDNLKLEKDFSSEILKSLEDRGHDMELVEARSSLMGHAGLVVRDASARVDGAYDPRSDGSVEFI